MTQRTDQSAAESESDAPDSGFREGIQTPGGLPDWLANMPIGDLTRPPERERRVLGRKRWTGFRRRKRTQAD